MAEMNRIFPQEALPSPHPESVAVPEQDYGARSRESQSTQGVNHEKGPVSRPLNLFGTIRFYCGSGAGLSACPRM